MYSIQEVGKIIEAMEIKHLAGRHNQLSHGRRGGGSGSSAGSGSAASAADSKPADKWSGLDKQAMTRAAMLGSHQGVDSALEKAGFKKGDEKNVFVATNLTPKSEEAAAVTAVREQRRGYEPLTATIPEMGKTKSTSYHYDRVDENTIIRTQFTNATPGWSINRNFLTSSIIQTEFKRPESVKHANHNQLSHGRRGGGSGSSASSGSGVKPTQQAVEALIGSASSADAWNRAIADHMGGKDVAKAANDRTARLNAIGQSLGKEVDKAKLADQVKPGDYLLIVKAGNWGAQDGRVTSITKAGYRGDGSFDVNLVSSKREWATQIYPNDNFYKDDRVYKIDLSGGKVVD